MIITADCHDVTALSLVYPEPYQRALRANPEKFTWVGAGTRVDCPTCNRHQGWIAIEISCDGQVAQSVEQKTENLRVGSSILPLPTLEKPPEIVSLLRFSVAPEATCITRPPPKPPPSIVMPGEAGPLIAKWRPLTCGNILASGIVPVMLN